MPEENRKQLVEALGPPFIVFREKVLDELKVSDEQREKLMQLLMEQIMETGPFLDSLTESGPEREKKLNEHRKNAREKLAKTPEGSAPARTTESAAPGDASARGQLCPRPGRRPERAEDHAGANEEIHGHHAGAAKESRALVKEAQSGGNPEEIRPKIEQLRKDHAKKLEAVLTDAQKKQWKELLGPPFELGD